MDHNANQNAVEDPLVVLRNQRLGLQLFAFYAAVYLAFILICVFRIDWMDAVWFAGVNNAVWSGFGLIALAMVVAVIYGLACRWPQGRSDTTSRKPTQANHTTAACHESSQQSSRHTPCADRHEGDGDA